ncbi:MAG: hypothetical protein Hals2KO_06540 [Halioglobus sp.]
MELITAQDWATIYLGLMLLITGAHMVVLYLLNSSGKPIPGLGLYTVYIMAALLGWLSYALKQIVDIPMPVDVPSVASILTSYILVLAAGARAGSTRGRTVLGLLCAAACFSVFFLSAERMFVVQHLAAGLFFTCTGFLALRRAFQRNNVGDAITGVGALLMTIGVPVAFYQALVASDEGSAATAAFVAYSWAYVLVIIGFLASVVIEYQQSLDQLNTKDPMTRLLNRRGLESALHTPLAQAARLRLPTSAIMIDIDSFQEINDNFGHDSGDQVILQVASFLQQMSRGSDVVARTDGEEFLLVLPHTDLEGARTIAERIRIAIAEQPLPVDGQPIPVTVSMGVASIIGEESLDKLSQDADRALQLARRGGGNRVASVESKPVHLSTVNIEN